jgi:hypothetical protein
LHSAVRSAKRPSGAFKLRLRAAAARCRRRRAQGSREWCVARHARQCGGCGMRIRAAHAARRAMSQPRGARWRRQLIAGARVCAARRAMSLEHLAGLVNERAQLPPPPLRVKQPQDGPPASEKR